MRLTRKYDEIVFLLDGLIFKSVVEFNQTVTRDETLQHTEGVAESSPKSPFDVSYYTDF